MDNTATERTGTRHGWLPRNREGLVYRLGVASRAVAAIVGGYALSALVATVMALYLPGTQVEATLAGMLTSFVVYTCAVMWVFAVRTAWRAWLGLLIASVPFAVVLLVHFHARSGT